MFRIKGRPPTHPVIVHVREPQDLARWVQHVPASAELLVEAFWPGPLTIVLNRREDVSDAVTGGQSTVAVRAPAHPMFREVLRLLAHDAGPGVGIAAPSANRFGQVSPTTAQHVQTELGDRLRVGRDVILDGGRCAVGLESTIVIWTAEGWTIAREGGITREQIVRVVQVRPDAPTDVRVPGTLDTHYAPRARVMVCESLDQVDPDRLPSPVGLLASSDIPTPTEWVRLAAPATIDDYARQLFSALRRADELSLITVVAVLPASAGLGAAIRDRLGRAAR